MCVCVCVITYNDDKYNQNMQTIKTEMNIIIYNSPMHMCMSIFSKEDDVHSHPIILYACSAHVQCVKVLDQTQ